MQSIDEYVKQNNYSEVLGECMRNNMFYLGELLGEIYKEKVHNDPEFYNNFNTIENTINNAIYDDIPCIVKEKPRVDEEDSDSSKSVSFSNNIEKYTVRLLCNWCTSKELCDLWNKFSKGNYTWENMSITWENDSDYTCVINCPPIGEFINPENTVLFQMEPNMKNRKDLWGEWCHPDNNFIKYFDPEFYYNNNEWHLSKTYNELCLYHPEKTMGDKISTILSDKYCDPGHIKRVDFTKFLDAKNIHIDVYGNNKFLYKNYQKSLPYHQKDEGIFPYKYTFNVENQSIKNYYTEKLIDGILGECLVFYHGCENIKDLFDEDVFVYLELIDFEHDLMIIKRAIQENWWEKRIEKIRKAKKIILEERNFFPRLESVLNNHILQNQK